MLFNSTFLPFKTQYAVHQYYTKTMAETADHQEDEIKNMLAKLLCVRAAALMEVYFKARISDYTNTIFIKFIYHTI